MGYVIVGIIVVLLVAAFITVLIRQATKRSSPASEGESPGIGGDRTPWLDTEQHAGEQSAEGETIGDPDAERSGGTGRPTSGEQSIKPAGRPHTESPEGRFQKDPIGGEAEARPFTEK